MAMKGWIKRPETHHNSSSEQRHVPILGITAAEVVEKEQPGEVSLKFTLANTKVLETNTFALPVPPSIKSIKAIERPGYLVVFEAELTDGHKIETNALKRIPSASPTTLVVANILDTLFTSTHGLDYGATERVQLVIAWDRDYSLANSRVTQLNPAKTSIIVNKLGKLTVQIALSLKIKAKKDVWMVRLWIVKKGARWPIGEAKIRLPSGKPGQDIVFDAGPYRFENLAFSEGQSFEVVLQCWADEKIHMGVNVPTTLEVMWFPP
jgi:hypothetical protein